MSGIYGNNFLQQAQVDQWLEYFKSEIENPVSVVVYQILGYLPADMKSFNISSQTALKKLKHVDEHLEGKEYLVGDSVTLADISFVTTLLYLYRFHLHKGKQKKLKNVTRVFESLTKDPIFLSVIGRVILC